MMLLLLVNLLLLLQHGLDGKVVLGEELVQVHVLELEVIVEGDRLVPDFGTEEGVWLLLVHMWMLLRMGPSSLKHVHAEVVLPGVDGAAAGAAAAGDGCSTRLPLVV